MLAFAEPLRRPRIHRSWTMLHQRLLSTGLQQAKRTGVLSGLHWWFCMPVGSAGSGPAFCAAAMPFFLLVSAFAVIGAKSKCTRCVTCACGGRAFGESIRPCHANCSDEAGRGLRPVRQCMNETCYPAAIKADMQVGKGTGRNQYPIKSVLPLGIQGCQYACHCTPRIEDCT